MSYLAIYRRFRPTNFNDVIGQEHVITTLINQIKTERVGHAYLFCGARGTGKTSVAKIFARAINCLTPENGSPCGHCEICEKLANPSNLDILEIDAASNNKVDNVQEIRTNVQYPPVAGRYKVYIIDEVHMLTTEAFNALLKTLEEPPKHAVFILATTEPHKLPATILSRCMRFDFHLVADKVIQSLIEKIYDEVNKPYEKEATALIAKSGEGSVRDALSLADLCLSYNDEKLTYKQVIDMLGASDNSKTAKLIQAVLTSSVGEVLSIVDNLTGLGKSVSVLTKDLCAMIRDILVVKTCNGAKEVLMIPDDEYLMLSNLSKLGDNHRFLRMLEIFTAIETDLRYSTHPRIVFETAAVKASLPMEDYNFDALISRIATLEKTVANLTNQGQKACDSSSAPPTEEVTYTAKSAYKPENKAFDEKVEGEPFTEGQQPKRLSGFDYVPEEDYPPIDESYAPPENQIGFGDYIEQIDNNKPQVESNTESNRTIVNKQDKLKEDIDEIVNVPQLNNQVGPTKGVIRDRIPDSRLWGTIIRKLRADKHIMLWIACQEADVSISENTLSIITPGDNEYNLLSKKESLQVLQSILTSLAPYTLKLVKKGVTDDRDESLEQANKVNEMFDGKLKIKD